MPSGRSWAHSRRNSAPRSVTHRQCHLQKPGVRTAGGAAGMAAASLRCEAACRRMGEKSPSWKGAERACRLGSHCTDGGTKAWRGREPQPRPCPGRERLQKKLPEGGSRWRPPSKLSTLCDLGQASDLLWMSVSTLAPMGPIPWGSVLRVLPPSRAARPAEGLQGVKLLLLTRTLRRQTPSF